MGATQSRGSLALFNKINADSNNTSDTTTDQQLFKNRIKNQQVLSGILTCGMTDPSSSALYSSSSDKRSSQDATHPVNSTTDNKSSSSVLARVRIAQCKIYGFDTIKDPTQGFHELYQLKDHQEAYYPIACYYYDRKQYENAFIWFKKCLDLTHYAKYRIGLMYYHGQGMRRPDRKKALCCLGSAANEGNKYAQFILGVCHQHGILVNQPDIKRAKMWYERSANQNLAEAQTALGSLLIHQIHMMESIVVNKETTSTVHDALDWIHKAEIQDNASALIQLGILYEEGILVKKDNRKAMEFYIRATKAPLALSFVLSLAHYLVGIHYRLGDLGIPQDYTIAIKHLTQSIKIGNYAPAQRELGTLYAQGIGTTQNHAKACELFKAAKSQSEIHASGLIGKQTKKDENYTLNLKSVIQLYGNAAKTGSIGAQTALAELLHRTGRHTHAFEWFGKIANTKLPSEAMYNSKVNSSSTVYNRNSINKLSLSLPRKNTIFRYNSKHRKNNNSFKSLYFLQQRNMARMMVARYRYSGWGGVEKDIVWAFEELKTLSQDENFADAHYWLADCYKEGATNGDKTLVEQDSELAFALFLKAAELGDVDGQFQVAYMLSNGYTTRSGEYVRDVQAAFHWYLQAAERGHKTAQYSLGMYYENGFRDSIDVDRVKAIQWYKAAADQNVTLAMVKLAKILLASDDCVDKEGDAEKSQKKQLMSAFDWLKKAVQIDETPQALRELATLYRMGLMNDAALQNNNMERYKIAFDLYQKAAEKKDAVSWNYLSQFYQGKFYKEKETEEMKNQTVVDVSFERAVQCLETAEKLGHSTSGLDLADLYYQNNMYKDTVRVYDRLADHYGIDSFVGWKSRVCVAKMVILENHECSCDQTKVFNWLNSMAKSDGVLRSPKPTMSTCENNHSDICMTEVLEILGYCFENGLGTNTNTDKAAECYRACVKLEDDLQEQEEMMRKAPNWAKQRCLNRLINSCMKEKKYELAFEYLQQLKPSLSEMAYVSQDEAHQVRRIKYYLGYLLLHGLGTEKTTQESFFWLKSAADEGEGDAAYELGRTLSQSDRGADYKEMHRRFQQGANLDHSGCMRELGIALLMEGFEQYMTDEQEQYDNGVEILQLFENAAELGDMEATYQLGLVFENGLGNVVLDQDIGRALEYYQKAANAGHEFAMIKAGEVLGNKLSRHEEAIEWYRKADNVFGNIKAKVLLVSYAFQGFPDSDMIQINYNEKQDANLNDQHHFRSLRQVIDQEIADLENDDEDQYDLLGQREKEEKKEFRKKGLGLALYILGQCYELGKGTTIDLSLAKEWYHQSVTISQHIDSMWRLGIICSNIEGNSKNALEWYRSAAEKGRHRESHYQLGLFHLYGLGGLRENTVVAEKYFGKASDQGHPLATYELARLVWNKENYAFGYELYRTAAGLHVPAALRELGHLSHTGFRANGTTFVTKDHKKAFGYYCEAAQIGDASAALMVGNYFEQGRLQEELGQDPERALQWYESAYRLNCGGIAELAIGKLKHTMADSIADKKEADNMMEEAFVWFESAASESREAIQSGIARIMVALYYLNGWGRKKRDPSTAFLMLLKAAQSGCSEAFVLIARCYEEGVGIKKDIVKARGFWELAAGMDDINALMRMSELHELGLAGENNEEAVNTYYERAKLLGSSEPRQNDTKNMVFNNSSLNSLFTL